MTKHPATEWLQTRQDEMTQLLREIVNIDSHSLDKPGVDAVGAHLRAWLEGFGIECSISGLEGRGDAMHAVVPAQQGGDASRRVLLMGHMDTVFPSGEAARRPFSISGSRGHGPGCADMKAGLVMNAFILRAFAETGTAPFTLEALFTGDEEIGSPGSAPIILDAAQRAIAVFNAEPGRLSGNVVNQRRGGAFYRVSITGLAAHAGLNPADGRSAIHELGRKIVAWNRLSNVERDVSVNVGLVNGGQSVNTVAPWSTCEIDLRFTHPEDESIYNDAITKIALNASEDGITSTIERMGGFSPMAKNDGSDRLTDVYLRAARNLGLATDVEFTRSCADSGLASSTGTPTICATGPVGHMAHRPDEYVELDTFVPRAATVALSILSLAEMKQFP
ncbi:MAG: hypothetical protein VR78_01885 [Hoeflea sp. BRH_c9]|nr:MAG: hypothetical protein VR78_01885 [Hoeflea sp. BRH_c9]